LINPLRIANLKLSYVVIIPVAVEKLGFSEKRRKSGVRKYLGDWGKSFVELPDAKQFLRILAERVFQQPPLFATVRMVGFRAAAVFALLQLGVPGSGFFQDGSVRVRKSFAVTS
jgi:hypothetical protein